MDTIKQLSERWINDGLAFKTSINKWLDNMYIHKIKNETACPEETRKDMSDEVKKVIIQYNKEGRQKELRELFPPDSDPMDWRENTAISQIAFLPDNSLVLVTGQVYEDREVHILDNGKASVQEGIFFFGMDANKKFFAKVYPDKIVVTEGWNGPVVSTFSPTINRGAAFKEKYPELIDQLSSNNFLDLRITQLKVYNEGKSIAVAAQFGIFVMEEDFQQLLEPEDLTAAVDYFKENDYDAEEEDGNLFIIRYDYPHIDVSADNKYIVFGSQGSSHLIYEKKDGVWKEITVVYPRASYPNFAMFNEKIDVKADDNLSGPQLLLSSCHFRFSGSLSLPVSKIIEGAAYDGYEGDENLLYVNEGHWVFSALKQKWGYALGANDGYVWWMYWFDYEARGYLHIGDTVMAMDYSDDRSHFVAATNSGQIIIYKIHTYGGNNVFRTAEVINEAPMDPYVITNTRFQEVNRYIFHNNEFLTW